MELTACQQGRGAPWVRIADTAGRYQQIAAAGHNRAADDAGDLITVRLIQCSRSSAAPASIRAAGIAAADLDTRLP